MRNYLSTWVLPGLLCLQLSSVFAMDESDWTEQSNLAPGRQASAITEERRLKAFNLAIEPFGALISTGLFSSRSTSASMAGSGTSLSGFMNLGFIPQVGVSPSLVASLPVYLSRIETKSTSSVASLDLNQIGAGLEWYVHGQRFASSFIVSPIIHFMWMSAAPKPNGAPITAAVRANFLLPTVMVGWRWFSGGFNFGLMAGAAVPISVGGATTITGPGSELIAARDLHDDMRNSMRSFPILPQMSIALGYAF